MLTRSRKHVRMSGVGSIWTWTALYADFKLIVSWRLGARDAAHAHAFVIDLADRWANRVQLVTDANRLYINAVENNLGGNVDYAQLVKQYVQSEAAERAYCPAKCHGNRILILNEAAENAFQVVGR